MSAFATRGSESKIRIVQRMPAPALFVDEDVRVMLAEILRQRGYVATHVLEIGREGRSDADQLEHAVKEDRAILTHNIRDYFGAGRTLQGSATRARRDRRLGSVTPARASSQNTPISQPRRPRRRTKPCSLAPRLQVSPWAQFLQETEPRWSKPAGPEHRPAGCPFVTLMSHCERD